MRVAAAVAVADAAAVAENSRTISALLVAARAAATVEVARRMRCAADAVVRDAVTVAAAIFASPSA